MTACEMQKSTSNSKSAKLNNSYLSFLAITMTLFGPLEALGQETTAPTEYSSLIRLDVGDGSMTQVWVRDQEAFSICQFAALAQMIDAWRFSHGDTEYSFQTSEFKLAIDTLATADSDQIDFLDAVDSGAVENERRLFYTSQINFFIKLANWTLHTQWGEVRKEITKPHATGAKEPNRKVAYMPSSILPAGLETYLNEGSTSLFDEMRWYSAEPHRGFTRWGASAEILELIRIVENSPDPHDTIDELLRTERPIRFIGNRWPVYIVAHPIETQVLHGIGILDSAVKQTLHRTVPQKLKIIYDSAPLIKKKIGNLPKPKLIRHFFETDLEYLDQLNRHFSERPYSQIQPIEIGMAFDAVVENREAIQRRYIEDREIKYFTRNGTEDTHALLVIGRRELNGKVEFLIQNSWGPNAKIGTKDKSGKAWVDAIPLVQNILQMQELVDQSEYNHLGTPEKIDKSNRIKNNRRLFNRLR